jgi:hypothetical protein
MIAWVGGRARLAVQTVIRAARTAQQRAGVYMGMRPARQEGSAGNGNWPAALGFLA